MYSIYIACMFKTQDEWIQLTRNVIRIEPRCKCIVSQAAQVKQI